MVKSRYLDSSSIFKQDIASEEEQLIQDHLQIDVLKWFRVVGITLYNVECDCKRSPDPSA